MKNKLKNAKLVNIISRKLIERLREEAVNHFLRNEEIKKAEDRIKELEKQEEDDKKLKGDHNFLRLKEQARFHLSELMDAYQQKLKDYLSSLDNERKRMKKK